MVTLYDPRCHDLAEHFLGDDDVPPVENEQRMQSLALAIQQAVEDWIGNEEAARSDNGASTGAPRE